jgi:hypothetical protein
MRTVVLLAVVALAVAASSSRFVKDVDESKLEKVQWAGVCVAFRVRVRGRAVAALWLPRHCTAMSLPAPSATAGVGERRRRG